MSLSSQLLYLAMYETWRFLKTILSEVEAGREDGTQFSEDLGMRRDELVRTRRDEDLDNASEEEMMKMLRGLSLVGEEISGPNSPSSSTLVESSMTRDPLVNLPDCVASSVARSDMTAMPDIVSRRRSSAFRLDSQWIRGQARAEDDLQRSRNGQIRSIERQDTLQRSTRHDNPQRFREVKVTSDLKQAVNRQGDYYDEDDDDYDDDFAHKDDGQSPQRRWSCSSVNDLQWRRRKKREEEDMRQEHEDMKSSDEVDGRRYNQDISFSSTSDHVRRKGKSSATWNQCGRDLTRISLRRNKVPLVRAEECSGRLEDLLPGRTRAGRRHSIAGGEVRARKSLVSDLVVLATLAGAYYCVNKLKSALL